MACRRLDFKAQEVEARLEALRALAEGSP